ncbi:MAG: hypothetical protein WCF84_07985 [Anaerolineae bacterium]
MTEDSKQQDGIHVARSSTAEMLATSQLYSAFELGWTLVELRSRVHVQLNDPANAPKSPGHATDPSPATPVDNKTSQDESQLLEILPGAALQRGGLWGALLNRIALLHDLYYPDSTTAKTLYDIYPAGKARPWALYPTLRPGQENEPDYAELAIPPVLRDTPGADAKPVLPKFDLYDAARRALNCLILLYLTPDDSLIWDIIEEYQRRLLDNLNADAAGKSQSQDTPAPASAPPVPGALVPTEPATPATTAATSSPNTVVADSQGGNQLANLEGPPHDGLHPHQHLLKNAQSELTILVVRLLEAWETYLRGVYNRSGLQTGTESRLVALEAGRNMASISWSMSTDMIGSSASGQDLWVKWRKRFDPESIIRLQRQIAALGNTLNELYYADPNHPRPGQAGANPQQTAEEDDLRAPDPDAPGTAADAINHSLDYWQRAIEWLQTPGTSQMVRLPSFETADPSLAEQRSAAEASTAGERLSNKQYNSMRAALIEQSNIWHLLLTGQQRLDAYTVETLRFHLQAQVIDVLEGASTDQLIESTAQVFNQMQILAQQAEAAVEGIASTAKEGLESLFRNLSPYLITAAVVGLIGVIVLIISLFLPGIMNGQGGMVSSLMTIVAGVAGGAGLFSGSSNKNNQQSQVEDKKTASAQQAANVTQPLASVAGAAEANPAGFISQLSSGLSSAAVTARKEIEDALTRGLRQVRIETQRLDFSIGVSTPLVEFFLLNFNLQGDYNVLTEVLWSQAERDEELKNIERAAFGSLSMLLGTRGGSSPLSAMILSVNRVPGTNQWAMNGTVRGKELTSWRVYVEDPSPTGPEGRRDVTPASNSNQPVMFGRLGTFDAQKLELKPGKYTVTLQAYGKSGDGKAGHEQTAQSTRWIDIPDLSTDNKKKGATTNPQT